MKSPRLGKDNWARTQPTKEGITFLALTIFVGLTALNTGNNLLYLVFGMMLSFIAASGIISMINLSWIKVESHLPEDVFALAPTSLKFSVKNLKYFIPSYSLTIDIEGRKAFLSYIPNKAERAVTVQYLFKKRGWNRLPQVVLFTRFPFGFFKKWIKVDIENREILVYPKIEKIDIAKDTIRQKFGEREAENLGFGGELKSIRVYNEGDNPKHIHWKTTAKTGKLMLQELYDDESKRVIVEFRPTKKRGELEREIISAASTFLELIKDNYEVEFIAPDVTFSPSEIGRSPRPVLRYLALFN
ncbi:MAG TPA: DUF58 domain-containing protein [Thermodesulfobacteriota bacterium]|nr:DUF58 domain-containing protein [Thermodesulfobacteriota bacterium]